MAPQHGKPRRRQVQQTVSQVPLIVEKQSVNDRFDQPAPLTHHGQVSHIVPPGTEPDLHRREGLNPDRFGFWKAPDSGLAHPQPPTNPPINPVLLQGGFQHAYQPRAEMQEEDGSSNESSEALEVSRQDKGKSRARESSSGKLLA